ncbi:MAG: hypothetical protein J6038_04670 [Bacilli bacterium]|nr:hypothetical protein [Bacilli bacterium]
MKVMLFCVFEDSRETQQMLSSLQEDGYNGTLMGASSVNHAFSRKADGVASYSLSDFAEGVKDPNLTAFFLLEEEELRKVQSIIREKTENFQKIHGMMVVLPATSYEGSF